MGRVEPPTRAELLRIAHDPAFAQEALNRWGPDALMDPDCEQCGDRVEPTPCARCGQHGIGLGDAIKQLTSFFGITPCTACERRARRLNRWRLPRFRR